MDFNNFLKNVISDLRIELTEEFDRNFERKAFFDEYWVQTKHSYSRGSLMLRTGDLRKSIESKISNGEITFSSSLPYASIHNEGGELTVTAAMKRFFWAKYYIATGGVGQKKNGSASNSKLSRMASADAQYYKSLALMKVGSKIKVPKRQFLGHHPKVDNMVQQICDDNVQELVNSITESFLKLQR